MLFTSKIKKTDSEIVKLQKEILLAFIEGNKFKVTRLQWRLVRLEEAQVEAIASVSKSKGGKTPGVDGVTWLTDEERSQALVLVKESLKNYIAKPVKRVMIDKPGKPEKRPLGIPTIMDRTTQKLWSMALLPISEYTADKNSYGGRPGKSTHDAIDAIMVVAGKGRAIWILEGDIKGFFDNIDKGWMMENIPIDKKVLEQWLNMGFLHEGKHHITKSGVPQGGVISPMIANMALDGLEKEILENFKNPTISVVRYVDDFVITGASLKQLQFLYPTIQLFMKKRGLTLHPTKTLFTPIIEGFDFLGFHLESTKQEPSKARPWFRKVLITPTDKAIKKVLQSVRDLDPNQVMTVSEYIDAFNAIIRGWTNYFIICDNKWSIYRQMGGELWQITHRWLTRKYPKASMKELRERWYTVSGPKGGSTMCAYKPSVDNKPRVLVKMIAILQLWNSTKESLAEKNSNK